MEEEISENPFYEHRLTLYRQCYQRFVNQPDSYESFKNLQTHELPFYDYDQ